MLFGTVVQRGPQASWPASRIVTRTSSAHRRGPRNPATFRSRPGGLRSAHRLPSGPHLKSFGPAYARVDWRAIPRDGPGVERSLRMKRILVSLLIAIAASANPVRAQDGMLSFPNDNAYVNVPSTPDLMPQSGLTVESWFYFDPAAPGGGGQSHDRPERPGRPFLHPSNELGQRRDTCSGSSGRRRQGLHGAPSPSLTPLLSWHHLAGTYDGATMRHVPRRVADRRRRRRRVLRDHARAAEARPGQTSRAKPGRATSTRSGSGPSRAPPRRSSRRCSSGSTTSPDWSRRGTSTATSWT